VRKAAWFKLVRSPTLEALRAPLSVTVGEIRVEFDSVRQAETEAKLRSDHQGAWVGYVERAANEFIKRDRTPTDKQVFDAILADARANHPGGEEQVWKYEAYVRAMARFVALRVSETTRYMPEKDRGLNDMLDMKLLSMLAVADLIVTEEKKLVAHLQQSGSKDVARLVTLAELLQRLASTK
jgi:hypothetical protein